MQRNTRLVVVFLLILAAVPLAACAPAATVATVVEAPARIEPIEGTEFNRVVLTEQAAVRLDIQTSQVREEQVDGAQRKVIPYGAILYDLHGGTWAYISPEPLTFVRQAITVDYIDGDLAVLTDGPDLGIEVATVGVAELYGIDTGVGK